MVHIRQFMDLELLSLKTDMNLKGMILQEGL